MNTNQFIEEKVKEIKKVVGKEKALVALSGGIDSSVVTILARKAIGDQLIPVFIDNGLMRENEPEWVKNTFKKLGISVITHEAQQTFLKALSRRSFQKREKWFSRIKTAWRTIQIERGKYQYRDYVEHPQEKRAVVEWCFYGEVIPKICREHRIRYWLQGTIKTDIEETQAGIKLQHNVRPDLYPERYGLPQGITPLKELRKNEVREVARALDLPKEITERPPFLGPGLAGRIVGEVTPEKVKLIRKATAIVEGEFAKLKIPTIQPFQYFPVLLKDRATGIKEGQRAFGQIITIRSVESVNARTARISKLPWAFLENLTKRITDEIPEVTRVVYDLTPKLPATIEYI